MSALVIHPGALGDVLLAIPALRALRADRAPRGACAPRAACAQRGAAVPAPPADAGSITLAAQPRLGALLVGLGVVDRAIAFDTLGLDALFVDGPRAADGALARHLAACARVVSWFGARDATFVRRLTALAPGAVIAPPAPARALEHARSDMPVWAHLLASVSGDDRAVRAAGGAGPRTAATALCAPVGVAARDVDAGRDALRAAGWDGRARVVIVQPGAGGVAKRWPAEGFADVLRDLDATVVVHEGPADADAVRELAKHAAAFLHLDNPALPTLAGALTLASAYVGNDSGVSHLAAAVGTPSLVLFTEVMLPWRPWSETARCVTVTTSALVAGERDAVATALRSAL